MKRIQKKQINEVEKIVSAENRKNRMRKIEILVKTLSVKKAEKR